MKSNWKSKPTPGSDGEFYTIYREPDGRAVARHVRPADAEHILTLHEDLDTALSLLGEITSYDYWRSYPVGLRTRAEDFIKPYDQEEKRVFDTQKLFYARIPGEEDASKAYLVKGMLGGMPFDGCGKPYAFSEKESKYLRDMGFETEEAK